MTSGALSTDTPAAQRYVAAAPACALLVGYALAYGARWLSRWYPAHRRRITWGAFLLVLLLAASDLHFYFRVYTPKSNLSDPNTLVANRLALHLRAEHPNADWEVVFFGAPRMGYTSIATLPYLLPDVQGLDMNFPWGDPENPQPTGRHLVFVFLPGHEEDMRRVMADYPGGVLWHDDAKDGKPLYWVYEVTPERPDR